jgi:hypothetical protein
MADTKTDLEIYKDLAAKYLRAKEHFEELHRIARTEADGYWTCLQQKQEEIDKIIQQRDALLAVLEKYGRHLPDCAGLVKVYKDNRAEIPYAKGCACGFEQAIAQAKPKE